MAKKSSESPKTKQNAKIIDETERLNDWLMMFNAYCPPTQNAAAETISSTTNENTPLLEVADIINRGSTIQTESGMVTTIFKTARKPASRTRKDNLWAGKST